MEIKKKIKDLKEKGGKWIVEHDEAIVRAVMFVGGISVGIFSGVCMVAWASRDKGYDLWEKISNDMPAGVEYDAYRVSPEVSDKSLKHPYFFLMSDEDYGNGIDGWKRQILD